MKTFLDVERITLSIDKFVRDWNYLQVEVTEGTQYHHLKVSKQMSTIIHPKWTAFAGGKEQKWFF